MNTDRVVVITGAAGGMGTLFVECFLANGDTVIAIDNDEDALSQLAGNVNVVTPGLTVTPKVKATIPKKMREAQVEARAIQREETGADLVGSAFFLASSAADFLSGQTINVDGGKHLL
jgi:NAD(P)-dependent dehydrogenase (short-subunit alcohol dehydrogenase family)